MVLDELVKQFLKLWDAGVLTVPWTAQPTEKELVPHIISVAREFEMYSAGDIERLEAEKTTGE